MLARQRQDEILAQVSRHGAVKVTDLCAALRVSDMTIRRDLKELVEQGLVERVHGGVALPRAASVHEPGFDAKSTREPDAKLAIARAAARLVRPGICIGISGGTTTHTFAGELLDVPGLTVVTNSLPVADRFHEGGRDDQTVLLTGGQRTPSMALVGPLTVATLERLHMDMLFLGTHGIDPESGLTCPNLLEAQTNQAMAAAARRVVVLADHTKWGITAIARTLKLSEIDMVVTDSGLDRSAREILADRVGDVVVAPGLTAEAAVTGSSPQGAGDEHA
ncbi:DeoR/GlpR family DNA-binding transcription regulator [Mycolicibacterium sp. CR10]|uniref:DeoR/GlpR family DNA-binding transcription regulator n=1 Tax=Mycolicibacterium sp. CR10 TaxID=2562314 RepID=UPI0010C02701|nr:DeoR/GlpR family DNA-binding transcription regulator [Mycolicibacterium sp. CR10]